jgi:hypothetical protein
VKGALILTKGATPLSGFPRSNLDFIVDMEAAHNIAIYLPHIVNHNKCFYNHGQSWFISILENLKKELANKVNKFDLQRMIKLETIIIKKNTIKLLK